PQTNGLVERYNKTLYEFIARSVDDVSDWDLIIPAVLFAYRTSRHATTKNTLFYLMYGREARQPIDLDDLLEGTIIQRTFQLLEDLLITRHEAVVRIQHAQQKQKARHDRKACFPPNLSIGDKVLLYRASKKYNRSVKLEPKWDGPFYVYQILKQDVYKLRTIEGR
ncbi:4087_t:CDS:1, partial [Ambispora leptoticha]